MQEGQGQGEDGKTRTEGWRGSELTKMKARARAREQTDKEDTSSWRWRQVARDSGPDNCVIRGREEGMEGGPAGGGQQEEEVDRKMTCQHIRASAHSSLLDFPFSGVARLAEPGTCPNQADCPIKSVLWLSQAELAHEPSQAHFGHELICWLS